MIRPELGIVINNLYKYYIRHPISTPLSFLDIDETLRRLHILYEAFLSHIGCLFTKQGFLFGPVRMGLLGRLLLTIDAGGLAIGSVVADCFNETHMFNPRWRPHAK